jgi:hypothetical protein
MENTAGTTELLSQATDEVANLTILASLFVGVASF